MDQLDASALRCPLPLLELKLWLKAAGNGQRLRLVLTDPGSRQDIPAYLERIGQGLEVVENNNHRLELIVTKHP
ncbi:sulfurtransferase TusA family protein [Oceanimonas sp. CHS3-5]|uniref:sulfurtransferase TusA family protein n=1 Tax=Oceanimonas sp. CHS3-5 TaxID=3068186 RepID=UPI00273F6C1F|nr:sulfurtransferase TusA family protein [Oceanimonas sp. CHS3-5]MDP5292711.1 sulfurtransferase TusA family protein [Oceanimonas sp. CHS3-5]